MVPTLFDVEDEHHHNDHHNDDQFDAPEYIIHISKILPSHVSWYLEEGNMVITSAMTARRISEKRTLTGNMLMTVTNIRNREIHTAALTFSPTTQLKNVVPSS